MTSPTFLTIDSTWDSALPVLLPLDAPTLSPIIAASMGLFVPFFLFVVGLFVHFYAIWTTENGGVRWTRAAFAPARTGAAMIRPLTRAPGFFQRSAPGQVRAGGRYP